MESKYFTSLLILIAFLVSKQSVSQTIIKQLQRGNLEFVLYNNGFKISDLGLSKTLLETSPTPTVLPFGFASYPNSTVDYSSYIYSIAKDSTPAFQWWTNTLTSWSSDESIYLINASFQNTSNSEILNLKVQLLSTNKLSIELKKAVPVFEPWKYRTKLQLKLFADEYFLGLGERLEGVAFRGKKMINWISEGRMGKPAPNPENQGNYRVPFYLSTRGYGLLLNENLCSSFDLGKTNSNINEIAVWDQQLSFTIYTGANPMEILKNYTDDSGRLLRTPEPWVFGVWVMTKNRNGFFTDTDRSYDVALKLRTNKIPCSAIWHQYWSEKINNVLSVNSGWVLDNTKWPNYNTLVTSHKNNGFNILHYYWPYIFNNDPEYNLANTNGHFMKNNIGNTYLNNWLVWFNQVAEPDFTRPIVRNWYKSNLMENAFNLGSSGWMADFGEHHRIEMKTVTELNPYKVHNEYPINWAKTNQEFWEQKKPNGDYVYFMRGGWTGIQKYSPVMWIGDPQFDWNQGDGLPSVIPAVLSGGISGHPLVSAHIAGYGYSSLPSNSEELWIRWLQTTSLFPVMWTHEGDELFFGTHLVFDQSAQTLAMFKKYSQLHVSFFPYIYTLVKEAKETGIPVVRSLYLHYPNDTTTISIKNEFLLGDRVLVAPVITSGDTSRLVYFPQGTWYNFWTGKIEAQGPLSKYVSAPLNKLPIFIKDGTILPLYNREIETLVKNVAGIKDFDYADSTMEVRFYGRGNDVLNLWDNTSIQMHRYAMDSATNISGSHPRQYTSKYIYDQTINFVNGITRYHLPETLKIYPNPTTGVFTLSFESKQFSNGQLQIFNSFGALITEERIGLNNKQFNLNNMPSGIYFLRVSTKDEMQTFKIIKE